MLVNGVTGGNIARSASYCLTCMHQSVCLSSLSQMSWVSAISNQFLPISFNFIQFWFRSFSICYLHLLGESSGIWFGSCWPNFRPSTDGPKMTENIMKQCFPSIIRKTYFISYQTWFVCFSESISKWFYRYLGPCQFQFGPLLYTCKFWRVPYLEGISKKFRTNSVIAVSQLGSQVKFSRAPLILLNPALPISINKEISEEAYVAT